MTAGIVGPFSDLGLAATQTGSPPITRMSEAAHRRGETVEPKQATAVEPERTETQVDREALGKAVEQIQAAASIVDVSLQFRIDEASNQVQVVVMNRDTEEVIREIPASEVLKAAARLKEVIGLLIDTTA